MHIFTKIESIFLLFLFPLITLGQSNEHPELTLVTIDPVNPDYVNIYWKEQSNQGSDSVFFYWLDAQGTKQVLSGVLWSVKFFQHKGNSPVNYARRYWIQRSGSGGRESAPHQTVYLSQQNYDTCQQSLSLIWTNYIGWKANAYRLYCKKGNNPFELINTSNSASDTVYLYENIDPAQAYNFYIEAESPDGSLFSRSNPFSFKPFNPTQPNKDSIVIFSVINNGGSVFLRCKADTAADLHGYIWQKITNSGLTAFGTSYQTQVVTIEATDANFPEGTLYQVSAIDLCNSTDVNSNQVKPVTLKAGQSDNEVNLSWNPSFINLDETYEIEVIGDNISPQNITGVTLTQYTIDLDAIGNDQTQEFFFKVTAIAVEKTSVSNTVCIIRNPVFDIANAFTPNGDGTNDNFGPVIKNADITSFEFSIYDRYGGKVFTTKNQQERWDGIYKGSMVSEGGYLYYIKIKTSHNQTIERKGAVNVVYP